MKKFTRQSSGNTPTTTLNIDFGAAAAHVARVFEPDVYKVRIEGACVVSRNGNTSIALDLTEAESGASVDIRPIWVDGPNAGGSRLAAANQHLIAQLLTLAGLPTSGNVGALIPQLQGLVFMASLVIARDNSRGRTFNELAAVFQGDET